MKRDIEELIESSISWLVPKEKGLTVKNMHKARVCRGKSVLGTMEGQEGGALLPPTGRQSPINSRNHWNLKPGVQEKGNMRTEMHKGRKISRKKSEKRSE